MLTGIAVLQVTQIRCIASGGSIESRASGDPPTFARRAAIVPPTSPRANTMRPAVRLRDSTCQPALRQAFACPLESLAQKPVVRDEAGSPPTRVSISERLKVTVWPVRCVRWSRSGSYLAIASAYALSGPLPDHATV